MSFAESATLAGHREFLARLRVALVKSAVAVGNEDWDETQPHVSRARRALAVDVLADSGRWTEEFAWAVVANGTITRTSLDGDLEWTVTSVWDAVAGSGILPDLAAATGETSTLSTALRR